MKHLRKWAAGLEVRSAALIGCMRQLTVSVSVLSSNALPLLA